MSENAIESAIQAKGLNAPRLNPQMIDHQIFDAVFFRGSDGHDDVPALSHQALSCLTICVLVLKNGYTVVGKSACASPENYDKEIGRTVAYEDARKQIWALEGYNLRSKLAENL